MAPGYQVVELGELDVTPDEWMLGHLLTVTRPVGR